MALYFSHPIFIELARYGFRTLPLSYPDRGKLIFVTALFGSHLFGLAMLWVRDRREKQKIPSNGEELDEITNPIVGCTNLKQLCLRFFEWTN
mgnify:CR=1 FL=1